MVEIESPLGKTSVNVPHRRVYTVKDENSTDDASVMDASSYEGQTAEEFLREQDSRRGNLGKPLEGIKSRQEMLKEKSRIKPETKKKLEILLGIGRETRDVNIDGVIFSLQTLKDHEIEELTKLPRLFDEGSDKIKESTAVEFLFHLRRVTLGYSLFSIDGSPTDQVLEVNDFDSKVDALKDLDNNLISRLFNVYEELRDETAEKYSIKSKKEVAEVVDNIKK